MSTRRFVVPKGRQAKIGVLKNLEKCGELSCEGIVTDLGEDENGEVYTLGVKLGENVQALFGQDTKGVWTMDPTNLISGENILRDLPYILRIIDNEGI